MISVKHPLHETGQEHQGVLPVLGTVYESVRIFRRAEILAHAYLTGGVAENSTSSDRVILANPLLIATITGEMMGEIGLTLRRSDFEVLHPLLPNEQVIIRSTIITLERSPLRLRIELVCECLNQEGEMVVRGKVAGHIRV